MSILIEKVEKPWLKFFRKTVFEKIFFLQKMFWKWKNQYFLFYSFLSSQTTKTGSRKHIQHILWAYFPTIVNSFIKMSATCHDMVPPLVNWTFKVRPHRPSDKVSAPHRGDGGDGNSHKSIDFSVRRRRPWFVGPVSRPPGCICIIFDEFSGLRIEKHPLSTLPGHLWQRTGHCEKNRIVKELGGGVKFVGWQKIFKIHQK